MTDAVRELFEMLIQKERSGSDYTGTVTSVDGNTAYVQFDGSDIPNTPVSMSIGAKPGDVVRVRVADGRAWLVGNDTAPPNDSSDVSRRVEVVADDLAVTNAVIHNLTVKNIVGANGWINLSTGTFAYGGDKLVWDGSTLSIKGVIDTTSGSIGGWYIGTNYLSNIVGTDKYVYLGNGTNTNNDVLVVRTGTSDSNYKWPFYVRADGTFHAEKGTVGRWTLGTDGFYANNNSIWMVTTSGGSIHLENSSGSKYSEMQAGSLNVSSGNNQLSILPANSGIFLECDSGSCGYSVRITNQVSASLWIGSNKQTHGIYSNGYYNGTTFTSDAKWILSRHANGNVYTYNTAGFERPIVTSADDSGTHVAAVKCNSATQLGIHGEWGVSGTYTYMYVSVSSSDPRLKYNIEPTTLEALPIIEELPMHSFNWLTDNRHWDVGFIAPELYDIDPNLCLMPEDEKEGYWGIDSFYLVGLLTKAVKELSAKVRALERRSA